jgi:hypothetical protein
MEGQGAHPEIKHSEQSIMSLDIWKKSDIIAICIGGSRQY